MKILVLNAGSSSLKYQLFDMTDKSVIAKGNCEKIGLQTSFMKYKAHGKEVIFTEEIKNHSDAIELVLKTLQDSEVGVIMDIAEIGAIGHRVLHGGEIYKDSVLVDDEVLKNLEELIPLGPLHQPANIMGIKACRELTDAPNVAVFDTAFHANMPKEAYMYGLPYSAYTDWHIRKYGFHGTSHKYVSAELLA